jgi:hypothetical protein
MVAPFVGGTQLGSDACGDGFGSCERVAPNADNPPASAAKQPGYATVAGAVAGDFALPILAVSLGHAAVPAAAVPEAAVHEDGEAGAAEDEVGAAGERLVTTPASDAGGAQNGRQP